MYTNIALTLRQNVVILRSTTQITGELPNTILEDTKTSLRRLVV